MRELTVVVADDEEDIVENMASRIEDAGGEVLEDLIPLSGGDLKEAIEDLNERERRIDESPRNPGAYDGVFDQADVLVLDYDMRSLYGGAHMTGETVAALARKYTHAGPIISVNRFGRPRFDLGLRADMEAWADLSIAHEDLGREGLWVHNADSYRPWYWPVLSELPDLFEERVDFAYRHRDVPVLEALGTPPMAEKLMPTDLYEELWDPGNLTFLDIASEGYVFDPKDPIPSEKQRVRAAASEVGKWLAGVVLPSQEVLMDAPHLVTKFPSLLGENPSEEELARLTRIEIDADLPFDVAPLESDAFKKRFWLDRPAWWTELITDNKSILENAEPWTDQSIDSVFAEDTSTFEDPSDCHKFRSDGFFHRRYVRRPAEIEDEVDYHPQSRFVD